MGLIWGTVLSVLGVVGAILITVAGRIVGDDVKEWLPWITRRLVERAVSRLPEEERERFAEEWWAHINELPGHLTKVYAAWGYLSASKAISDIAVSGDTTNIEEVTRRVIELTLSVLILLVVLPLMLVISICIELDSPGPVFFRHRRLGANKIPFNLLKFRSMYVEQTDLLGNQLMRAGDPRITRVGRFLRMLSLDELPQLINVLRGEMSLVGPPPPLPSANVADASAESETPILRRLHRLKPGITGWAQLNGWRGEARNITADLYYLQNLSLRFDFLIIARTLSAVLSYDSVARAASAPKDPPPKIAQTFFVYIFCIIVLAIACLLAGVLITAVT